MRRKLLLIVAILFGISIQAVAGNSVHRKAPYPVPPTSTPTGSTLSTSSGQAGSPQAAAPSKNIPVIPTSTPIPVAPQVPKAVVSTPTVIATPVPGVTVWPSTSTGGHCILFKAAADPGTTIQLTLQNAVGGEVFTTAFSGKTRSGGYVWRLQDRSGSPVAGGVYSYTLRFQQQGQNVTAQGKVTVR